METTSTGEWLNCGIFIAQNTIGAVYMSGPTLYMSTWADHTIKTWRRKMKLQNNVSTMVLKLIAKFINNVSTMVLKLIAKFIKIKIKF